MSNAHVNLKKINIAYVLINEIEYDSPLRKSALAIVITTLSSNQLSFENDYANCPSGQQISIALLIMNHFRKTNTILIMGLPFWQNE